MISLMNTFDHVYDFKYALHMRKIISNKCLINYLHVVGLEAFRSITRVRVG